MVSAKKKAKKVNQPTGTVFPFRSKTIHIQQLLVLIWIPLILVVPVLVFQGHSLISHLVLILVLFLVFLSWFNAAQGLIKKK
jgi:hypothetical protein